MFVLALWGILQQCQPKTLLAWQASFKLLKLLLNYLFVLGHGRPKPCFQFPAVVNTVLLILSQPEVPPCLAPKGQEMWILQL